ncbi:MAG: polymer-forming cytoskeletal protein [Hyphomicrobium sp.]
MSILEKSGAGPPPEQPPGEETPSRAVSVLGSDITLVGSNIIIVSQGKLELGGSIVGDVHAREVLIRPEAFLKGELWAERIDVQGEVCGSMIAVDLALHDTAKATGDIMYQRLSVAEGAKLEARAHLIRDPSELMPILDAEALARGRSEEEEIASPDAMQAA